MPYLIRDEGLVLGKEPVFHTYEEAAETLKTLTIPQFPKHIRKKLLNQKLNK